MRIQIKFTRILKYVFLIIASLISIFPFFWMVVSATNKTIDVTRGRMTFGTALLSNLHHLFTSDLHFWQSFFNSAIIAVVTTILALVISSAAGYGFSLFKSKWKERLFTFLLLSMMVPFAALMIPLFRLFSSMGNSPLKWMGINTFTAVIIPYISTAFLIFFFRQNSKSFPKDLLEAARIDGVGEMGIFFKIYMPTMKSSYAAAAIITFMNSWNNYLWPLIALQSPQKRTLPLIISSLSSSYTPDYGMIMAAIVIATIPTALIFFFMQKHFVEGMIGSVK